MQRTYTMLGILLLLTSLLTACREDPTILPSGKTVRIGVIAPLSGPDKALGKSGLQGVELAVELHPLLDNGDKLELVVIDDQSRPEQAAEALDELADQKPVAVLVLSQSNNALRLADRARLHKLPIIATIATHPDLTKENPHLIQLSYDDAFQAAVAALFLRDELLLARAAVFYRSEDAHSQFLADEFVRQFKKANGTVVDRLDLTVAEPALANHLVLLREDNVELLYVPVDAGGVLKIATMLKEMGWSPVAMAGDGLLSEILLKHPGQLELVDGLIATDMHSSLLARTTYGEEIHDIYRQQETQVGSTFTMLGSEGTSILVEALNNCSPPYEPNQLQRKLRQVKHFEGFAGTIAISSNGKAIRPVYVNTIRGRKLEFIVKVY